MSSTESAVLLQCLIGKPLHGPWAKHNYPECVFHKVFLVEGARGKSILNLSREGEAHRTCSHFLLWLWSIVSSLPFRTPAECLPPEPYQLKSGYLRVRSHNKCMNNVWNQDALSPQRTNSTIASLVKYVTWATVTLRRACFLSSWLRLRNQ